MWTEMLHSFYRMPAILYVAGVPTRVTLRWYKAPAGAKQLPFPSTIFSHVWDNNPGESQPGEIGEVGYPRTWDPGDNHGYQGQCYRGDPAWFQTGQLPALPLPASPCGCQIPPAQAAGGLVLTGSAAAFAGVNTCAQCPVAPAAWTMIVSGGSGGFAGLNTLGVRVPYVSACTWQISLGGRTYQLHFTAVGGWQIALSFGTASAIYGPAPGNTFSCVSPTGWALSQSAGTGTPPNSVQAFPTS